MAATRPFAICLLCATSVATADGLDAERFVPAISAEGGFVQEHPVVPHHLGWGLGLFVNFADDAVVERAADDSITARPVDTSLTADLLGSIGLFGRLELGLHLPVHLLYEGDDFIAGGTALSASAGVGDLRFVPKLMALSTGTLDQHFLLGFAVPIRFPTGDAEAFRGSGGLTVEPRILFAAHFGMLGLGIDLGFRYRTERPPTLPWAHEIAIGPWVSYGFTESLTARVELYGGKHVGSDVEGADFPLEVLGGIDYRFGNVALYGGGAIGLTDGIGDPDFRAVVGIRYRRGVDERQGFKDSDGDGILDKSDDCQRDPEDTDGYRDEDGCPEPDNDQDGILDADDECPELSGEADRRGCPARTFVKIDKGEIVIIGKVQFRSGSADIDQGSDQLLDQIAQALDANQHLKKIRIEGHTDNVGDDTTNQKLSKARADSVKAALVKRGVSDGRLSAEGIGEARPIAPNTTEGGRQKNRRVEFFIVEDAK